jgi:hypothetical protein
VIWTISSRTDIDTYVANEQPDFTGALAEALGGEIQNADHPDYGGDWAEWLNANIEALRESALESCREDEARAADPEPDYTADSEDDARGDHEYDLRRERE